MKPHYGRVEVRQFLPQFPQGSGRFIVPPSGPCGWKVTVAGNQNPTSHEGAYLGRRGSPCTEVSFTPSWWASRCSCLYRWLCCYPDRLAPNFYWPSWVVLGLHVDLAWGTCRKCGTERPYCYLTALPFHIEQVGLASNKPQTIAILRTLLADTRSGSVGMHQRLGLGYDQRHEAVYSDTPLAPDSDVVQSSVALESPKEPLYRCSSAIGPLKLLRLPSGDSLFMDRISFDNRHSTVLTPDKCPESITTVARITSYIVGVKFLGGDPCFYQHPWGITDIVDIACTERNGDGQFVGSISQDMQAIAPHVLPPTRGIQLHNPASIGVSGRVSSAVTPCLQVRAVQGRGLTEIGKGGIALSGQAAEDVLNHHYIFTFLKLTHEAGVGKGRWCPFYTGDPTGFSKVGVVLQLADKSSERGDAHVGHSDVGAPEDRDRVPTPTSVVRLQGTEQVSIWNLIEESLETLDKGWRLKCCADGGIINVDHGKLQPSCWLGDSGAASTWVSAFIKGSVLRKPVIVKPTDHTNITNLQRVFGLYRCIAAIAVTKRKMALRQRRNASVAAGNGLLYNRETPWILSVGCSGGVAVPSKLSTPPVFSPLLSCHDTLSAFIGETVPVPSTASGLFPMFLLKDCVSGQLVRFCISDNTGPQSSKGQRALSANGIDNVLISYPVIISKNVYDLALIRRKFPIELPVWFSAILGTVATLSYIEGRCNLPRQDAQGLQGELELPFAVHLHNTPPKRDFVRHGLCSLHGTVYECNRCLVIMQQSETLAFRNRLKNQVTGSPVQYLQPLPSGHKVREGA